MVSQTVKVNNPTGLHLRPAGMFCQEAMRFKSHIVFRYRETGEANAKSVLSILGACIRPEDEIEIICDGADEKEALQALVALVESGFGEA
ncbi:MAG: HPr family phosphocarrier protein [Lachnospiraceae bacterium]|jgi:phosphocarrier protein|nr:HPr family phosphocarrier protein [Lachnospiraceae bacterium]MBQ1472799.1 HPr family phosphocarrier protein [Lachnospiraceae bacterium]MBQ1608798.1 HPr family phosphocarrier protein [Lachnospiraceae bacterium]MBQ1640661.1 HPr family phosphocarrier protein [Lachnospiraceae bacterium]MBQ1721900.1 HPr family phosphocarrier protein [Lachnospiraceae bacterium]